MTAHLTYFDVRGRAEVVRLILEETATPYTETRVQLQDWAALKPTLPFGQLPLFQDGDVTIVHSHAIYRHLARKHDLYGTSELERTRCDMAAESYTDAFFDLNKLYWDPQFAQRRDDFEKATLPDWLDRLQRMFEQNQQGNGFWVGTALSYVDLLMWHYLDYVRPFSQRTLDQFGKLAAFKQRIETRPRIAAYLKSSRRPATLTIAMAPFGGAVETS